MSPADLIAGLEEELSDAREELHAYRDQCARLTRALERSWVLLPTFPTEAMNVIAAGLAAVGLPHGAADLQEALRFARRLR